MPERFDDLPVLAGLGASLRASMAHAEAVELAAAPSPAEPRPEQHARRWRRAASGRFGALSTVLVLGLVGTAAAAATLTLLRGSPIPGPRAADLQPSMTVRPDTARVLDLRAADPTGQGLPFALRTAASASGLTCATVGQVDGGDFGLVGNDGRFRELPETIVDGCGELRPDDAAVAGARVIQADRYEDVRTVVYGIGGSELRSADLIVRGKRRALQVEDGAFVTVVAGYPEDSALSLRLQFAGGRRASYPLGQADTTVLDPTGPALSLFPMGIGGLGGNFSCVDLRPARATGTQSRPATPPACTPSPRRSRTVNGMRTVTIRAGAPWYFDVRTFQPGDRAPKPRDGLIIQAWRWHLPEARTVVWGSVRPQLVTRVLIKSGGVEVARVRRNSPSGAFGVVLPATIAAKDVDVVLVLRKGGTRTIHGPANLKELPSWR